MTGVPEGSTESGSGEAGDRTGGPWFTRNSAYPLHHGGLYTDNWHSDRVMDKGLSARDHLLLFHKSCQPIINYKQ